MARSKKVPAGKLRDAPSSFVEVLVPMHSDNWALALASGYIGCSLKADPADDVQSLAGGSIIGFIGSIPRWAMEEGERGARVVLKVNALPGPKSSEGMVFLDGPIRISKVSNATFESPEALASFAATMRQFPDISLEVVPSVGGSAEISAEEKPAVLEAEGNIVTREYRESLDFMAGWAAGLLKVLEGNLFDAAVLKHLATPSQGVGGVASSILLGLDPAATPFDVSAWGETVSAVAACYRSKGFDRSEQLDLIASRLGDHGEIADRWISGCRKVVNGEIDLPSFSDDENIGRRAALALLLVHDQPGLQGVRTSLAPGPRVLTLLTLAVHGFIGYSKLGKELKEPLARLSGTLEIAEALADGQRVPAIEIPGPRFGSDLSQRKQVVVAGEVVLERHEDPPHYLLMLKARALEAGYTVEVDTELNQVSIMAEGAGCPPIAIEESSRSTADQPVANLVLPLVRITSKTKVATWRSLLERAAECAAIVGIQKEKDNSAIVAIASIPIAKLDRDELKFHVESLVTAYRATPEDERIPAPIRRLPGI